MHTKTLITAAVLFGSAFTVKAANEVNFIVEAKVPGTTFYVVTTGWDTTPIRTPWNEQTLSLAPIAKDLKMKNDSGGIKAYLTDTAALRTPSSLTPILLDVMIFNKSVGVGPANATDILTAAEANTEQQLILDVTQRSKFTATTRPAAGAYTGAVTLVFENIPTIP